MFFTCLLLDTCDQIRTRFDQSTSRETMRSYSKQFRQRSCVSELFHQICARALSNQHGAFRKHAVCVCVCVVAKYSHTSS